MELSIEDLKKIEKLKIGGLVKSFMKIILEKNLITKTEIENLQKKEYSKFIFDVNYPILKKYDKSLAIKENIEFNGGKRYYVKPVENDNEEFFITNHWYDYNKENFVNWLKRKVSDL